MGLEEAVLEAMETVIFQFLFCNIEFEGLQKG